MITPFVSWEMLSMNEVAFPDATGSVTAVCFVLTLVAAMPESTGFPLLSNDARFPETASVSLSALAESRSLTALDVAAVVSDDEFVDDESCTIPAADVLACVIAFLVAVISPSVPWLTVSMNSVVVSEPVVGLDLVKSFVVTVPDVPVTTPRPEVLPILPSLVIFPWVWLLGVISVGKSLTWLLVIEMFWKVAFMTPSVSVSVASVLPLPNPVMPVWSSLPIASAIALPDAGFSLVEEYVLSTVTFFLVIVVMSPLVPCTMLSMKARVLPEAAGVVTWLCLVLKSAALLPESCMLPLASSETKLPSVNVPVTLSAFPVARSLTAFDVAAVDSDDELSALDSWTMPASEVLAGVIAFLVAVISPSVPWDTVSMNSVVVDVAWVVGLALVKFFVVNAPPVPVTTPSSAVVPILPSLVMFPWVWVAAAELSLTVTPVMRPPVSVTSTVTLVPVPLTVASSPPIASAIALPDAGFSLVDE